MSSALPFALPVLAYLIGSISFAVLVSKLFGLHDPRRFGSGNPGATNVLRTGNKTAAVLTLLGDCLKGTVAVCLAKWLGADDVVLACVALAAFCGHVFSIFLRGKGGKGVATALGVLLGLKSVPKPDDAADALACALCLAFHAGPAQEEYRIR